MSQKNIPSEAAFLLGTYLCEPSLPLSECTVLSNARERNKANSTKEEESDSKKQNDALDTYVFKEVLQATLVK